jgi:hypothetical protein
MRIAILKHCRPALDTLLQHLTSTSSPIAAVRPLLAPHMRFIFDQAAQSGNAAALQLLLLMLPEHYEALGVSALEAALSEGHAEVAATLSTLLIMQGPDPAAAAAALSPEGNVGLAQASLHGAYKGACVRGDLPALQSLLQQGPDGQGPDDNMQLLLLRLAAGAGKEEAVRLLLGEFGGVGPRLEANLKAVCRGAVHAGQLQLLQVRSTECLGGASCARTCGSSSCYVQATFLHTVYLRSSPLVLTSCGRLVMCNTFLVCTEICIYREMHTDAHLAPLLPARLSPPACVCLASVPGIRPAPQLPAGPHLITA